MTDAPAGGPPASARSAVPSGAPTPAPSAAPLVAAHGLLVGYAEDPVCPAITLAVRPGEALAVVGQNGAGKSTLLRTVTGILDPLGGTLTVLGGPVDERTRDFRAAVAVLGDDDVFFPALTVAEHLLLVARGHLVPEPEEVVEALLDEFGIADHATALPRALSSGQRRRLLLAAVFARPRSLLVLDEPEQRLDTAMRLQLAGLLAEERDHGGAVLFACHDPAVVRAAATGALLLTPDHARLVSAEDGARAIEG